MGTERNWSSEAYKRARAESQHVETLMRSILKLFADGSLTYRSRTRRTPSVQTKSDRLKRIRRSLVPMPFETGSSGPAVVA